MREDALIWTTRANPWGGNGGRMKNDEIWKLFRSNSDRTILPLGEYKKYKNDSELPK